MQPGWAYRHKHKHIGGRRCTTSRVFVARFQLDSCAVWHRVWHRVCLRAVAGGCAGLLAGHVRGMCPRFAGDVGRLPRLPLFADWGPLQALLKPTDCHSALHKGCFLLWTSSKSKRLHPLGMR